MCYAYDEDKIPNTKLFNFFLKIFDKFIISFLDPNSLVTFSNVL